MTTNDSAPRPVPESARCEHAWALDDRCPDCDATYDRHGGRWEPAPPAEPVPLCWCGKPEVFEKHRYAATRAAALNGVHEFRSPAAPPFDSRQCAATHEFVNMGAPVTHYCHREAGHEGQHACAGIHESCWPPPADPVEEAQRRPHITVDDDAVSLEWRVSDSRQVFIEVEDTGDVSVVYATNDGEMQSHRCFYVEPVEAEDEGARPPSEHLDHHGRPAAYRSHTNVEGFTHWKIRPNNGKPYKEADVPDEVEAVIREEPEDALRDIVREWDAITLRQNNPELQRAIEAARALVQ